MPLSARNMEIRRRARDGEKGRVLAAEYGVTRQFVSQCKLWEPPAPHQPRPPKARSRRYYGQFICSAGGHPTNDTLTWYAPRKYACPECLPSVQVPAVA